MKTELPAVIFFVTVVVLIVCSCDRKLVTCCILAYVNPMM